MAAEMTPVISIELVQSVADLKNNIKELKKAIDDANTSTDEYADLTKALAQNQAALRNVMNGTNSTFEQAIKSAQGLDTSYNSLVQQLKEATQEWRTIPKYLSEADKAQGIINQAWTEAANKVLGLRTELKGMDADTGSFVRNVGNYKSALEGFSGTMGTVRQIGGDMNNGITALASTFAIAGYNTDGLTEAQKSLMIALAAVQGVKGLTGLLGKLASYIKAGKQAVQATKEQTAATQAQTAAQTGANAATAAGTVALSGLQKALIATGIGALVVGLGMLIAHFEDIVKWVGGVLEKLGLLQKQTDTLAAANERLNEKLEEQNHTFDNQAKLLRAQGKSQKDILILKREMIKAQIKEKEAVIGTIEARLAEIETHSAWKRFWKGENRERKEQLEMLKTLREEVKKMKQDEVDINIDIKVEGINEAKNAADKAKKDAEEAYALAKKIVDNGISVATNALKGQETELQKINREYKEQVDTINSAITATQKLSGDTSQMSAVLNNGLDAAAKNYTKALSDYYKKEYEKKAAEDQAQIVSSIEAKYEREKRYESILKDVLNLDALRTKQLGKATAEQMMQYEILSKSLKEIREDIELPDLDPFKNMSDEQLQQELGQPLATAIKMYFQKEKELNDLGITIAQGIFSNFEDEFTRQAEAGNFAAAQEIAIQFKNQFYEKFKELGLGGEILEYFIKVFDEGIAKAQLESVMPQGFSYLKILFPPDDFEILELQIAALKSSLSALTNEDELYAAEARIAAMEEALFKKRLSRFSAFYGEVGKYFNTYGKATANVMDSVADAWNAALQAQVKNGKKSEEQAKQSFENIKRLQMASAIINTAGAVVQALADPTVPSYYVKIANAAAALIAGTAQVIQIANTEFTSSASNSTSSTPELVDRTPQLQYTVGLNPQDYAEAQAEQPIHCYITDRELNDGLEQYRKREDETTF